MTCPLLNNFHSFYMGPKLPFLFYPSQTPSATQSSSQCSSGLLALKDPSQSSSQLRNKGSRGPKLKSLGPKEIAQMSEEIASCNTNAINKIKRTSLPKKVYQLTFFQEKLEIQIFYMQSLHF